MAYRPFRAPRRRGRDVLRRARLAAGPRPGAAAAALALLSASAAGGGARVRARPTCRDARPGPAARRGGRHNDGRGGGRRPGAGHARCRAAARPLRIPSRGARRGRARGRRRPRRDGADRAARPPRASRRRRPTSLGRGSRPDRARRRGRGPARARGDAGGGRGRGLLSRRRAVAYTGVVVSAFIPLRTLFYVGLRDWIILDEVFQFDAIT